MAIPDRILRAQRAPADLLPNEQEVSFDQTRALLERNKPWIIGFCVVIILAAVGFTAWNAQERKRREEAVAQLALATTPEMLQSVTQQFSGTDAALMASMKLADTQFQQAKYEKALATYGQVIEVYPTSIWVPSAMIGQAAALENTDKMDEALKKYQAVVSAFPQSFQAPQALFASTTILENTGKLKEANQGLDELLANYPDSSWKGQATARRDKIKATLTAQKAQTPAPQQP